ncbi:TonB-dependent receptor [Paraglaciecola sp.]|uniref:TonB-dependent receptor domain-containing protein n=1 Tax=Paraglaciecola sp. TaxID=1920173 RepID=UPI0030F39417
MKPLFRPCLLALSIALATVSNQSVSAPQLVSLQTQPLSFAIERLSKQYDLVIVAPESLTQNIQLQAVRAKSSVVEALKAGLAHTDLTVTENTHGAIIIKQKSDKTPPNHSSIKHQDEQAFMDEVVVIGTYIKGGNIADTLPISMISGDDITNNGVLDGADLLRMLPQAGNMDFNESNFTGGVNTARGDIASVNLRSVGTGNTLMLINGRRMAKHPAWQNQSSVPVVTYNMNTIPTAGVANLQVMRDGASALYGADAVAGVINTVMIDDYDGVGLSVNYGKETTIGKKDIGLTFSAGNDFADGKGHISVFSGFNYRNAVASAAYPNAASDNRLPLLIGTDFEGITAFDSRSSIGPYGYFDMMNSGIITLEDGTTITDSSGRFHTQPTTNQGCITKLSSDICLDDGKWSYAKDNLSYWDLGPQRELFSERKRFNLFSVFNYDLSDNQELYGELGVYISKTKRTGDSARVLSNQRFLISKNAYWNPFGAKTLADGSSNPNRLTGTNVPVQGVDLKLVDYRVTDAATREANIINTSYRGLVGTKGYWGEWNYDSALLYSIAFSKDTTPNSISVNMLQAAINKQTPDAYNPFCGACNSSEVIAPVFADDLVKKGKSELALMDFKISNEAIFTLPAGPLGFAAGVEYRYESFEDDRDVRLDGTYPFIDSISGVTEQSDSVGDSPTNDIIGDRTIFSAFSELSIPVVSPEQNIPLIQAIDIQLAGRYESFSDVSSTAVPRIATSWAVNNSVMFRGSWSKGFRVPNLVQSYTVGVSRQSSTIDYARCEAKLQKGEFQGTYSNCKGAQVEVIREPTKLKSETSTNKGLGLVLTPSFLPGLTLTADYWEIEQKNVIGVLSSNNQSALDMLYRSEGEANPNVIRAALTEEDKALFTGTNLLAAGEIAKIIDPYENLDSRIIKGTDYALEYRFDTDLGDFTYNLNLAQMDEYKQQLGKQAELLKSAGIATTNLGNLVGLNGSPEWQANSSFKWHYDNWRAGIIAEYTGKFDDTSASIKLADDQTKYWEVKSWYRINTNVSYRFEQGDLAGLTTSFGIKNLLDKYPPLADERFGVFGKLHTPEGRYVYVKVSYKL